MESFNSQLQAYLERSMRAVATESLVRHGGVESASAGGTKATVGLLRGDLEQVKQELKQEARETRDELAVAAEAQGQRMAALEAKLEAMIELLAASR